VSARWDVERCAMCERDIVEGAVWFAGIGPVCFDCAELKDERDHQSEESP
jgi:hypothetical protein